MDMGLLLNLKTNELERVLAEVQKRINYAIYQDKEKENISEIKQIIQSKAGIPPCVLQKKNSYENELCLYYGFNRKTEKFYDAEYKNIKLEIKKQKNQQWIDLVKLAIIYNDTNLHKIVNIFITYKDKTLNNIYFVSNIELAKFFNMNDERSFYVLKTSSFYPSCQSKVSISEKDYKEICFWSLYDN